MSLSPPQFVVPAIIRNRPAWVRAGCVKISRPPAEAFHHQIRGKIWPPRAVPFQITFPLKTAPNQPLEGVQIAPDSRLSGLFQPPRHANLPYISASGQYL